MFRLEELFSTMNGRLCLASTTHHSRGVMGGKVRRRQRQSQIQHDWVYTYTDTISWSKLKNSDEARIP